MLHLTQAALRVMQVACERALRDVVLIAAQQQRSVAFQEASNQMMDCTVAELAVTFGVIANVSCAHFVPAPQLPVLCYTAAHSAHLRVSTFRLSAI